MKRENPRTRVLVAAMGMLPLALFAQMPPQTCKLVISSEPTGAAVTINGKKMDQPTNATFVVYPGTYKVSVKSSDGTLVCADTTLTIIGGKTLTQNCTKTGWQ
jgi:hypothetical protein